MAPVFYAFHPRAVGNDLRRDELVELILPIATTLVLALRVGLAKFRDPRLGWDDFFLLISLPFIWVYWALWYHICTYVYSRNTRYDLPKTHRDALAKETLTMDQMYSAAIMLIKFAICAYYLRTLRTSMGRKARCFLYLLIAWSAAALIVRLCVNVFSCRPFAASFEPKINGHCINLASAWFSYTIINWVNEICIFIFPIPFLWRLSFSTKTRYGIYVVFFLAMCALAATGVRLYFLSISNGAPHTIPPLVASGLLELCLAAIIISLPPIYSCFRREEAQDTGNINQSGRQYLNRCRREASNNTIQEPPRVFITSPEAKGIGAEATVTEIYPTIGLDTNGGIRRVASFSSPTTPISQDRRGSATDGESIEDLPLGPPPSRFLFEDVENDVPPERPMPRRGSSFLFVEGRHETLALPINHPRRSSTMA